MSKIFASRYHDISTGHRVVGHENKCRHLHGHNYRIHFHCEAEQLDSVGRVVDFGVIKEKLCMWVEDNWDHRFLAYENDPVMKMLYEHPFDDDNQNEMIMFHNSVVWVPFNPTAENMAQYLVDVVGPDVLKNTNVTLSKVVIEETAKCSVTYERVSK